MTLSLLSSQFSENFFLVCVLAMLPDAVSIGTAEVAVQTLIVIVHRQVQNCWEFTDESDNLIGGEGKVCWAQHIQNPHLLLTNDVMLLLQMLGDICKSVATFMLSAQNHVHGHQHVHAHGQLPHWWSQFIWIWHCSAQKCSSPITFADTESGESFLWCSQVMSHKLRVKLCDWLTVLLHFPPKSHKLCHNLWEPTVRADSIHNCFL